MNINNITDIPVNVEFLAEIFAVDVRTIQNYAKFNELPRNERGEYPLVKCLLWLVEKLKAEKENLSKENPLSLARLENLSRENEMKQLRLRKMQDELLDAEQVRIAWVSEVKNIVRNIDALAPSINKIYAGDSVQLARCKKEIDELKITISNSPLNLSDDFDDLIDDEETKPDADKL